MDLDLVCDPACSSTFYSSSKVPDPWIRRHRWAAFRCRTFFLRYRAHWCRRSKSSDLRNLRRWTDFRSRRSRSSAFRHSDWWHWWNTSVHYPLRATKKDTETPHLPSAAIQKGSFRPFSQPQPSISKQSTPWLSDYTMKILKVKNEFEKNEKKILKSDISWTHRKKHEWGRKNA